MKLSTNRKPEAKSILLIGPPGGGKTTFALQFPKPYLVNCDQNLDGPDRYLKTKHSEFAFGYDDVAFDDNGSPVAPPLRWARMRSKTREAGKNPEVGTIIVDSLTHADEYLLAH